MKKKLLILGGLVLVAIILALVVFGSKSISPGNQTQQQAPAPAQEVTEREIIYQGVDGRNALELLKEKYQVETKAFAGIGEMVTSIDGEAADDKHFWAFYVNGQMAQEGAGTYITKSGETIVWKLEEIR